MTITKFPCYLIFFTLFSIYLYSWWLQLVILLMCSASGELAFGVNDPFQYVPTDGVDIFDISGIIIKSRIGLNILL
jgi:hypothetical protein